jgi:voltage-gated potassium channel
MVLALIVYVYITSLHVYAVENSAPGATIDSWGNSVWWTIVTMATVGFGDFTPITIPGRIVAVGNMVVGVIVIGITSATVVNYLSQLTTKAAHDQPQD